MSDTERILEIIKVKDLNNIQFCSATGISPASLSHITSNRSKPTLSILRNVIAGFPDINPEWVMMGTGPMFRQGVDTTVKDVENAETEQQRKPATEQMSSLFPADEAAVPVKPGRRAHAEQEKAGHVMVPLTSLETMVESAYHKLQQKRKVVEVKIFFDDGTFETIS